MKKVLLRSAEWTPCQGNFSTLFSSNEKNQIVGDSGSMWSLYLTKEDLFLTFFDFTP